MEELFSGYPVIVEIPVAWGEMDAMQHVNNAVYFRWFESARIAYFDRIRNRNPLENDGMGLILHSIQCRYRLPLTYPDTVSVAVRVTKVEADRFVMHSRIISHQHRKVAAESEAIMVSFNYREQKKVPLPEATVKYIQALETAAG
ncbi:MAG: thioesterase family protein [Blastocatellia bacterium]